MSKDFARIFKVNDVTAMFVLDLDDLGCGTLSVIFNKGDGAWYGRVIYDHRDVVGFDLKQAFKEIATQESAERIINE